MGTWIRSAVALIAVLIAGLALVASRGDYAEHVRASYGAPLTSSKAPSLVRTCVVGAGSNWLRCARLTGRVIWIQRADPDGDGDVHLLVVARFSVHVVKISPRRPLATPGIGSRITVIGAIRRGANVDREIEAFRLSSPR